MLKARKSKQLGKASTQEILGDPPVPGEDPNDYTAKAPELQPGDYEDPKDQVDLDNIRRLLVNNDLSGGFIRLLRKGPMDSQFLYVAKIDVEQFDVDQVKKTYGGGDYQAYAHRANGKMYRRFTFGIDPRMKGAMDEGAIRSFSQNPSDSGKALEMMRLMPQPVDNTPLLMKVMETTSQKSDQMMMLMMTMMSKSQETQVAAMTQAQQSQGQMMASMMTAMATMMTSNKGSDNTPILIEMIKAQASGKSALSSISETMDLVKQIKDISDGKKSGDGEDDEGKEETMLDKLIKLAGPIMQSMSAARQPQVRPQTQVIPPLPRRFTDGGAGGGSGGIGPAGGHGVGGMNGSGPGSHSSVPIPIPAQTQPSPGTGEPTGSGGNGLGPEQQAMIGLFLNQCLAAARRNSDPSIYADMIIDNLDDNSLETLQGILTGEDWCARLFASDQRVLEHMGWFDELRQLIVSAGMDEQVTDDVEQVASTTHGDAVSQTPLPSGNSRVIPPTNASASQPATKQE